MFRDVLERIDNACTRSGRERSDIKLVAVTKGHSVADIKEEVLAHGHRILGENRIQEWRDKSEQLDSIEWHMIGNLQRNKVKYCRPFSLIHSLNSVRLADELNGFGRKKDHTFKTLIEVNIAGEDSKQGLSPKNATELFHYCQDLENLEVTGLMTLAPYYDNQERTRPIFVKLCKMCDKLNISELSMGMSNDFEVAIEEGATLVRIGSALFS